MLTKEVNRDLIHGSSNIALPYGIMVFFGIDVKFGVCITLLQLGLLIKHYGRLVPIARDIYFS